MLMAITTLSTSAMAFALISSMPPPPHRALFAPRMAVSFEDAVSSAPGYCAALQDDDAPSGLQDFLGTSAGARGFFVNWLTDDQWTRADEGAPPTALATALETAPQEVVDVMVMNVVMSAATAVAHRRAGNDDAAEMSDRTSARARLLVCALRERVPALATALLALRAALSDEGEKPEGVAAEAEDSWVVFLQRWTYDDKQLDAVDEALKLCGA